jgi:hypothetical protein
MSDALQVISSDLKPTPHDVRLARPHSRRLPCIALQSVSARPWTHDKDGPFAATLPREFTEFVFAEWAGR